MPSTTSRAINLPCPRFLGRRSCLPSLTLPPSPRTRRLALAPPRPLLEQALQVVRRRPPRLAGEVLVEQRADVVVPHHAQAHLVQPRHHEVTVPDLRVGP